MKITISHPHGNPNSFQAAEGFAEAGWLCSFQRGLNGGGLIGGVADRLPGDARDRIRARNLAGVSPTNQRTHLIWETISRLGNKVKPSGLTSRINWYDVLFCGHDLQVSRQLERDLDTVYAYEDGAHWTFKAAKRSHAAAIYELPLGYYAGVAHELERARRERPSLSFDCKIEPEWKRKRKELEIELADLIVVPCAWAAESLQYSKSCSKKPLLKIPYGTPTEEVSARNKQPNGPFTVLFAGQIGARKGVPLLLEAWKRLGLKNARLLMAGSISLDHSYLENHDGVQYLGTLPRVRLLETMKEADLLVFPSLAEGFGLVIGEAMAAGVAVLTTKNTGGPELITEGREGWCVPAHDVDSLVERLEWAYRNRDAVYQMGIAARRKAEQWTWSDYRRSLIENLTPYIGRGVTRFSAHA